MKKLAALAITAGLLLTGCGAAEVQPTKPTSSMSKQDCYKEAFELLKKDKGVQYLIDYKEEANAFVSRICS